MLVNNPNFFYYFIYIIEKNASKLYKTQLNKSYCEYQDKTANIIREKSRTDPKGLWTILNNIDKNKSDFSNNVTLEQFTFVLVNWKNYTLRP
jgi:hypothetical protein